VKRGNWDAEYKWGRVLYSERVTNIREACKGRLLALTGQRGVEKYERKGEGKGSMMVV
jgi:hypothetical protein